MGGERIEGEKKLPPTNHLTIATTHTTLLEKKHLEDFNDTTKESFWSSRDAAHAAIRTCSPLMYQLIFI
jgi:hypothetical protein